MAHQTYTYFDFNSIKWYESVYATPGGDAIDRKVTPQSLIQLSGKRYHVPKNTEINVCFWKTAHLPLPKPFRFCPKREVSINVRFGQFPRNLHWSEHSIITTAKSRTSTAQSRIQHVSLPLSIQDGEVRRIFGGLKRTPSVFCFGQDICDVIFLGLKFCLIE